MTQDKITMDRLKLLAVLSEEKFKELHPDVKDGDYVDVVEYLQLLFDIMIIAGVRVPSARIGDQIYVVYEDLDNDGLAIDEVTIEGLALLDDSWWFCCYDREWYKIDENCFFERSAAEKAISEKIK